MRIPRGGVARDVRAEFVHFRRAPEAIRSAARAGGVVLIVLVVLWWGDRLEWAVYATFGAFASVYGSARRWSGRWRLQAALGVFLTAAVGCGALVGVSEHRQWLAVPVAAVWASVAAALSDRFSWRPPGPMFAVFAVAVCGSIPTSASTVAAAIAVAAVTAVLAVGLGALEVRLLGSEEPPPPDGVFHPPHRQVVQAVRVAVAVAAAGVLATGVGIGHPYWAMVAAVVPLGAHTYVGQLTRGVQRVLGTAAGLLVAAVLLQLSPPLVVLVVLVAGLQACAELLIVRNYGTAMVVITPLALVLGQLADPQRTSSLIADRAVETLIGVGIGLLIAVLTRERLSSDPR